MPKLVPNTGTLRRYFKRAIFGSHVHCPSCKSRNIRMVRSEERWRCSRCHLPFSIKSSSWLKGSKLPLEAVWLLLRCWQRQYPLQHATDLCGVSYPTASAWYARFRDHIPRETLDILLSGELACDELYTRDQSVLGAKQKGTRNVALRVIHEKSVTKSDALDFLQRFAKAGSHVCTDGSRIYRGMDQWCQLRHSYEVHKRFEFTLTAEIEGVWAVFRTFVRRMYHHVTRYRLAAVVAEFCLRFRQHVLFQSPDEYLRICLAPKPFAF
jgi:transposase-like protein